MKSVKKMFAMSVLLMFAVGAGCMNPAAQKRVDAEAEKGKEIYRKIAELEAMVEDAYKKAKKKELSEEEAAKIAKRVAAELPLLYNKSDEVLNNIKRIQEEENVEWWKIVGAFLGTVGSSVLATYVARGRADRKKIYLDEK